jgi:hypothetical protein
LAWQFAAFVKSKTISDMARARKIAGASAATIRRDLTAVSRVLTHAESLGLYEGNPTLSFRKTLRERRNPIELPTREAVGDCGIAATVWSIDPGR